MCEMHSGSARLLLGGVLRRGVQKEDMMRAGGRGIGAAKKVSQSKPGMNSLQGSQDYSLTNI